ncbi:hypothetical protein PSEUDO8AS_10993 [Pseudomonas sp. 8AS]|nr:hypothetical protein PSEUDO8AS_10993 [Pseudomonas sp. 8AS]
MKARGGAGRWQAIPTRAAAVSRGGRARSAGCAELSKIYNSPLWRLASNCSNYSLLHGFIG